jgi:hypothetical protein
MKSEQVAQDPQSPVRTYVVAMKLKPNFLFGVGSEKDTNMFYYVADVRMWMSGVLMWRMAGEGSYYIHRQAYMARKLHRGNNVKGYAGGPSVKTSQCASSHLHCHQRYAYTRILPDHIQVLQETL